MRVLRHCNKLSEVRDYRVWLVRIAWNLVLDRKRRAKTRPEVDDFDELARVLPTGELSAEKMVITAQRHARILGLIDALPSREREVLLLSAVKELSTVEIAQVPVDAGREAQPVAVLVVDAAMAGAHEQARLRKPRHAATEVRAVHREHLEVAQQTWRHGGELGTTRNGLRG